MARRGLFFLYAATIAAVLIVLVAMGLGDRDSLRPLIAPGGAVENAPAILWVAMSALALRLGWRQNGGAATNKVPLALAVLGLLLAGEELGWGRDLLGARTAKLGADDLHNHVANLLIDAGASAPTLAVCVVSLILVASIAAAFRYRKVLLRAHRRSPALVFVAALVAWAALSLSIDLIDRIGLDYIAGQWVLEESSELFAALAGCFAVVAHYRSTQEGSRRPA